MSGSPRRWRGPVPKGSATRASRVLILPPLAYAPAPFANAHAGTLSIRPETLTALVVDLGRGARAARCRGAGARQFPFRSAADRRPALGGPRAPGGGPSQSGFPRSHPPPAGGAARRGVSLRRLPCRALRDVDPARRAAGPGGRRGAPAPAAAARSRSSTRPGRGQTTFVEAGLDLAYCGDPAAASAGRGPGDSSRGSARSLPRRCARN